jgi:protease IV
MKRRWTYVIVAATSLLIGIALRSCEPPQEIQAQKPQNYRFVSGQQDTQNRLLEVTINGVILNSEIPGLGAIGDITNGYDIQKQLEQASKDDKIKGIFLKVRSPGGTIVGSDVIYNAVKTYREKTKKPVVAYIDGLSASGGVMSMVAADRIYAAPGSLIGSIGVVMAAFYHYDDPMAINEGLLGGGIVTRNGIKQTIVSAGRSKDLGNPFRKPTDEELRVLREGTNREYDNFVQRVAQARGIEEGTIRDKMGALIFDNAAAQTFKLIDDTKSQTDAIAALAKQANLGENYQLIKVQPEQNLLGSLLGTASAQTTATQTLRQAALCSVVESRTPMIYHGNVGGLCSKQ